MSRGRRYEEPKLNMKKVFAVIIAFVVIIMFIFMIKGFLTQDEEQTKIVSKTYFSAFQNNKWGIIDEKGAVVIDPSYEEMMIVPNEKKDVFLCIYDVNYETGEYNTKALNSKNEEIFTQYDQIEAIGIVDNGQASYMGDVLKVQKDGKYGLINLEGKELQTCQFDDITSLQGMEDVVKVQKDGKYGLINTEGKEIVSIQYTDIQPLKNDNTSNFIVADSEGKYGVISNNNEVVIALNYEQVKNIYSNNYFVVQKDGKEILAKKDGTEVVLNGLDEITGILKNEENGIIFVQGEKYGVMNLAGEVILEAKYDDLKEAKSGIFIAEQNGKYGIIDEQGNEKLGFTYQNLSYYEKADLYVGEDESFNNSIIDNNFEVKQTGILVDIDEEKGYFKLRQNDEYRYYNFKFEEQKEAEIFANHTLYLSKKDGKYGFVDKEGNVVVDYIYDDATMQNDYGYAGVKKDGKWGSVDDKGNVIQEPTYNLDDYLQIDFVGRWHYGKDINMNYYNQI